MSEAGSGNSAGPGSDGRKMQLMTMRCPYSLTSGSDSGSGSVPPTRGNSGGDRGRSRFLGVVVGHLAPSLLRSCAHHPRCVRRLVGQQQERPVVAHPEAVGCLEPPVRRGNRQGGRILGAPGAVGQHLGGGRPDRVDPPDQPVVLEQRPQRLPRVGASRGGAEPHHAAFPARPGPHPAVDPVRHRVSVCALHRFHGLHRPTRV